MVPPAVLVGGKSGRPDSGKDDVVSVSSAGDKAMSVASSNSYRIAQLLIKKKKEPIKTMIRKEGIIQYFELDRRMLESRARRR